MKKALIVLSGGQDSTTCLAFIKANYPNTELSAVTFDYGQKHRVEIESAYAVARLAGIADRHEVIKVPDILAGMSPLTNPTQPLELYKDHSEMEAIIGDRVEKTFVPLRNALFLTIAANRAHVMGADVIVTGVCEADNANYPDCRQSFINAQEHAINEALGVDAGISIFTPLMRLTKAQSVRQMVNYGMETFAWLAFSHTAYDGQYPPLGKDHASVLRAHGFEQAGFPDPLVVRASMEGRMMLPMTPNYAIGVQRGGAWWDTLRDAIAQHGIELGIYNSKASI